jgi:hypothetical protein
MWGQVLRLAELVGIACGRLRGILVVFAVVVLCPGAQAQDCKAHHPGQHVTDRMKIDVSGSAQTIWRIGSAQGEVEVETLREVKNLYEKYPNADMVLLRQNLIYMFCTLLSGSNLDYERKRAEFDMFMKAIMGVSTRVPEQVSASVPAPTSRCVPSRDIVITRPRPTQDTPVKLERQRDGSCFFLVQGRIRDSLISMNPQLRVYVFARVTHPWAPKWWKHEIPAVTQEGTWSTTVWTGDREHPTKTGHLIAIEAFAVPDTITSDPILSLPSECLARSGVIEITVECPEPSAGTDSTTKSR